MEDRSLVVNPKVSGLVLNALKDDIWRWWQETKGQTTEDTGWEHGAIGLHGQDPCCSFDLETGAQEVSVKVEWTVSTLFQPKITVRWLIGQNNAGDDRVTAFIHTLQDIITPSPRDRCGWWADENLYLVRPVVKGEHAAFPPFPDWTIVDPETYEQLKEAKRNSTPDNTFHPSCVKGLRKAADDRLRRWQHNLRKDPTWDPSLRLKFALASRSDAPVLTGRFIYDIEGDGIYNIKVDISKPFQPRVRQETRFAHATPGMWSDEKDAVTRITSDITDLVQPHVRSDGLWWADENYYPIRPVYEGEDLDKKPDPKWTLVNGATGDVIHEAYEAGVSSGIYECNPKSLKELRSLARLKLQYWLEAFESDPETMTSADVGDFAWHRQGAWGELEFSTPTLGLGNAPGWRFKVRVQLTQPLRPTVMNTSVTWYDYNGNSAIGKHPDAPKDLVEYVIRTLQEVAMPEPHSSGLWWADENLYLQRPFCEGEVTAPPVKGWALVDPNTHEEYAGEELADKYDVAYGDDVLKYVHTYRRP